MKTILLAKSSSGEPYQVEFLTDGNSLRVFCHCQAGIHQQVCKHKLALLKGDVAMLFDPQQSPLLSEVHSLPQYGSLKNHIAEYETKLKELEVAKEVLAKKEKSIKSDFARGLAFGFK